MKFSDPFATLQYLGGAVSIHCVLAAIGVYLVMNVSITLEGMEYYNQSMDNDILIMCVAHIFSILLFVIKKSLSKKTDAGAYIKVVCNIFKIVIYWAALLNLLMVKTTYYTDFPES